MYENEITITEEEKRRAAYALNMCMVSVSQIIDYDDLYILEQEYDAILNNLNLEEMPKDDALLDILKQLLDTISYFRITDQERGIFEKEYQQKMKNAIWSAVPNIGIVSTGGNWFSIAASLASQVGIGYMNYRRAKADILLEKEKNEWKLHRTAMEQFHGLRRELFDTAWRLADKYQFPDKFRITEKQIKAFNEALLDRDDLRRYERLDYMRDEFAAYPPFRYYLGSAANAVAQSKAALSEGIRNRYRGYAKEHFKQYLDKTEHNLLREDQLLASCALEQFSLLSSEEGIQRAELKGLIDRAIKAAGSECDVLELCALSYLEIGEREKAAKIFRMLVNRPYNEVVNAQLLSSLYVSEYIKEDNEEKKEEIYDDYYLLSTRVRGNVMFPMPQNGEDGAALEESFVRFQKEALLNKVAKMLKSLVGKYTVLYNKAMPAADLKSDYSDEYYSEEMSPIRMDDIIYLIKSHSRKRDEFQLRMSSYFETVFNVLNSLYYTLLELPAVDQKEIYNRFRDSIQKNSDKILPLMDAIENRNLNDEHVENLFALNFRYMTESVFEYVVEKIAEHIKGLDGMGEISKAEAEIQRFCNHEKLSMPVVTMENAEKPSVAVDAYRIDINLLGKAAQEWQRNSDKKMKMLECIKEYKDKLVTEDKKPTIILYINDDGDSEFKNYSKKNSGFIKQLSGELLAVLDDKAAFGEDILFTTEGIVKYVENNPIDLFRKTPSVVAYTQCKHTDKGGFLIDKTSYSHKQLEMKQLYSLVDELARIQDEYRPKKRKADYRESGFADYIETELKKKLLQATSQRFVGFVLRMKDVHSRSNGRFWVTAKIGNAPVHVGDQCALIEGGVVNKEIVFEIEGIRFNNSMWDYAEPGKTATLLLISNNKNLNSRDLEMAHCKQIATCNKANDQDIRRREASSEPSNNMTTPDETDEETTPEELDKMITESNKALLLAVGTTTATGAIPLPFVDIPLLISQQVALMAGICKIFRINISNDSLKMLATAALTAGGVGAIGKAIGTSFLKMLPVVGTVAGGAISAGTNAGVTYAMGKAFINVCKAVKTGKLSEQDLTASKGIEMFKDQFKVQLKNGAKDE